MRKVKCQGVKDVVSTARRLVPLAPSKPTFFSAVSVRRQKPEEESQFNAAFELFLDELVRQHLDPHTRA